MQRGTRPADLPGEPRVETCKGVAEMKMLDRWIRDADDIRREARSRAELAVRGSRGVGGWGAIGIAAIGAAIGAAVAFLLDPDRGRSRRARYGAQAVRSAGRHGTGELNDAALTAKVETELFRDPTLPKGTLNVNVERGIVVLRGQVDSDAQRKEIEVRAAAIPGVWSVRNLTHVAGEPAPEEE